MIKKGFLFLAVALCCLSISCRSQQVPDTLPAIESEAFSDRLERLLNFSVPLIGVQELANKKNDFLVLDTREEEEYNISHIPNAKFAGYKKFKWELLDSIDVEQPIVLYCSVGYRSEKMGERLKEKGYKKVYNLYGSIFEWANEDLPLVDKNGNSTKHIHTYSGKWSRWVEDGELIKVW